MKRFKSSILLLAMIAAVGMLSGCSKDDDDVMASYLVAAGVEASKEATSEEMTFAAAVALAVEGNYDELAKLIVITDIPGSIERFDEHNIATVREIFETGVEDPGARTVLLQTLDVVDEFKGANSDIVQAMLDGAFYADGVDVDSEIFLASSAAMEIMNGDLSSLNEESLSQTFSFVEIFFRAAEAGSQEQMKIAKQVICKFAPIDPNRYSLLDKLFDVAAKGQKIYFDGARKGMEEFVLIFDFMAKQYEMKHSTYETMIASPQEYLKHNGVPSMPGYATLDSKDHLQFEYGASSNLLTVFRRVEGQPDRHIFVDGFNRVPMFAELDPICVDAVGGQVLSGVAADELVFKIRKTNNYEEFFETVKKNVRDPQTNTIIGTVPVTLSDVEVVSEYGSGLSGGSEYVMAEPIVFWDPVYVRGLVEHMYCFAVYCHSPGLEIAELMLELVFPAGPLRDGMFGLVETVGGTLQNMGVDTAPRQTVPDEESDDSEGADGAEKAVKLGEPTEVTNVIVDGIVKGIEDDYMDFCENGLDLATAWIFFESMFTNDDLKEFDFFGDIGGSIQDVLPDIKTWIEAIVGAAEASE